MGTQNDELPEAKMAHMCDLCGIDVSDTRLPKRHRLKIVDGATVRGPWAYMCVPCFRHKGVGLGTGKGQLYDVLTGEKLAG